MTTKEAREVRRIFTSDYFAEGWALYVEGMMRDAGFFTPEQELGQLEARLFRAARIVVDTSLHTGEMSVDEAVAFMHEKALLPLPTARSEVARYCAWPTQASAYLTGAMAIEAGPGRLGGRRRRPQGLPRFVGPVRLHAGSAGRAGHRARTGDRYHRCPPAGPSGTSGLRATPAVGGDAMTDAEEFCNHLDQVQEVDTVVERLRGLPARRGPVGAPQGVHDLRSCGVL